MRRLDWILVVLVVVVLAAGTELSGPPCPHVGGGIGMNMDVCTPIFRPIAAGAIAVAIALTAILTTRIVRSRRVEDRRA